MNKVIKDIAASARQRIKNQSFQDNRPFAELLQYYAMERFLYRLSQSEYSNLFILKGALMLRAWQSPEHRPTLDIDMLGKTSNSLENICAQISDVIAIEGDDGLVFHPDTLQGEEIREDADYHGVRVTFLCTLQNARVKMQIDIGFGDVIHPKPIIAELPTILELPAPRLLCYSCESAIAEKFQTMVKLGMLNSRMKDFFDIWLLSRQFEFIGNELSEAIRLTLDNRGTTLPDVIDAFTPEFIESKQAQWKGFCRNLDQEHVPLEFDKIVNGLVVFLEPIVNAISTESTPPGQWNINTGWS